MSRFASAAPSTKAALITATALGALALWSALTMAIALAGLHRWSAHIDLARAPAWFWWFRADPQVRRWLAIAALGTGLLTLFIALGVATNQRRPLHGAARWAREHEIRREKLRAPAGILLGAKAGRMLSFGGSEHVLLYAPTRSGKGVGVVIPNLLSWSSSAVVLDIKRENYDATAGFRAAHGQRVHLFDPLAADGRTARYNPLGHIDRHKPAQVLDELQKIAGMLFPAESARADPFWSESARTGFIGVGAYVAETTDLPFTLGQVFRELTQGSPKLRFPTLIADHAKAGRPLSSGCVSALTDFCAASDNTFASIRQTITSRMGLWLNPLVDTATSDSDFDLRTLRRVRQTIYLAASPDNLSRVAPLYSLLFQQLVDVSTRRRPTSEETGQVLLVLDEFARLGHAGVLAHGFSFVAGYGLRMLAVLQSPSQLRAEYGPDLAEEIVANCGVEIAFTPKELKIAQELSARLGDYTYEGRSRSRPSGLSSGRRSQTESEQRRALMLPQELPADAQGSAARPARRHRSRSRPQAGLLRRPRVQGAPPATAGGSQADRQRSPRSEDTGARAGSGVPARRGGGHPRPRRRATHVGGRGRRRNPPGHGSDQPRHLRRRHGSLAGRGRLGGRRCSTGFASTRDARRARRTRPRPSIRPTRAPPPRRAPFPVLPKRSDRRWPKTNRPPPRPSARAGHAPPRRVAKPPQARQPARTSHPRHHPAGPRARPRSRRRRRHSPRRPPARSGTRDCPTW